MTRRLSALLAGLLLLAGATGCAPRPSATPTPTRAAPIVVGLTYQPDIQFAPFYVADAQGWFADAGLTVTLRHHGASETLFGALTAGAEQIVFAGGDEMVQARSQGTDVVSFATVFQTYPVVLIVPDDSPIRTLADLRGHSVGLPGPFGENWFALQVMLASGGLSAGDVTVMNIGYTQQAALTGRKVDAVVGFVNNDVVQFQASGLPVRTLTTSEPMPLAGVGLGTTAALLRTRQADLVALTDVVKRAVQYCIDHPQAAVTASAAYVPGLNEADQQAKALATLTATIPLFGTGATIGTQDEALWPAMAQFMNDHGLLAAPVTASEAYTSAIAGARPA